MTRRENGRVVIELSEEEFALLLIALGYATVAAKDRGDAWAVPIIRLANTINEGNPHSAKPPLMPP